MQTPREFQDAAFASVDGVSSGYTALSPHIPAQSHFSTTPILGNNQVVPTVSQSERPSLADASTRMGGDFPEYSAITPSVSR